MYNMFYKRKAIFMKTNKKKRSPEEAVNDFINFCNKNKACPNQNSTDYYEKSLAQCVANYKRNRHSGKTTFSDEQLAIIEKLQATYGVRSPQKTPKEKYELLCDFCTSHGKWPSQNSTDKYEKRIYETCCRTQYYIKDPTCLNNYNTLKANYLPFLSPSKVMAELRPWIQSYKTTPRENSKNELECKLAKEIKCLKSKKKFSDSELIELDAIYNKFGPRGGTSIFEQLLYHYLISVVENGHVSNRNSEYFGYEIDILIKSIDKTIAIFYDGAFFHQDATRDNKINENLTNQGVLVIRFREEGSPTVNNCISVFVKSGTCYQDFLNKINQYFTNNECPIKNMISTECVNFEKILKNAIATGSTNYLVRNHLLNYIENALLIEDKPETKSKIYRNCKACLQRNQFTAKETLLYAFTKRLFDSSPRKKRNIDAPSVTNDDIELLSKIIESFMNNTPYDRNTFKETLIERINNIVMTTD